jgi:hypothetical protein
LPGPITEAIVNAQLRIAPSRFYRHRNAALREAGRPTTVASGPFRGMIYARHAADKCLLPRLLGTYECEVHGAVERLCESRPDVVVVAGAGEGYYAVGLARRIPTAVIIAYDGSRWARHLLRQMAIRNCAADRVRIEALVTPAELERSLQPARRPVLVCDVDGFEFELVHPQLVPTLARTIILMETHEHLVPGLFEEMRRRFGFTHQIERFQQRRRTLQDLPAHIPLSEQEALWAMDEYQFRSVEQFWLYMTPINSAENTSSKN